MFYVISESIVTINLNNVCSCHEPYLPCYLGTLSSIRPLPPNLTFLWGWPNLLLDIPNALFS